MHLDPFMTLRIADPAVVIKVERLARSTGLSKTAVVERALDLLTEQITGNSGEHRRIAALLAQLDRIPDREDALANLQWDGYGLPK